MVNIIVPPTFKELAICDQILDYIDAKDLFNYFTDTPEAERQKDPFCEFVNLCRRNLGFAAKHIIGKGDFELLPFQCVMMDVLWEKTFPLIILTRGGGKTTMLAVYSILRAILDQNSKSGSRIVVTAASFRQSKLVLQNVEHFFRISPLMRACCDNPEGIKRHNDKWEITFGHSSIIALPLGDGQRIRGERATHVVTDEFASVPEETFNVVIGGFAAVSQNPVDKVRALYRKNKMRKMGFREEDLPSNPKGNQIVRSGTGSYEFNHFYKTYLQYMKIIKNKLVGFGRDEHIRKIIGEDIPGNIPIDYKNYAIIQMPDESMPPGYMDENVVAEAMTRMTKDQIKMEYKAGFVTDSNGFFKASAINYATPPIGDSLCFQIELQGEPGAIYVMGLDPARKRDDFGLVIIKCGDAANKLVYMYRWNKKNFGIIANEIRRLCKVFNIARIGIDQGGGGTSVLDFLQTPEMIPAGELPFFEIEEKGTLPGIKILDMINYMGEWLKSANYDLAADIEHRRVIFPYSAACNASKDESKTDEVFDNILECKKQLTSIEITATDKTEIEHFDVPEEVKWKAKKDLYSALLIAAYEARQVKAKKVRENIMSSESIGGAVEEFAS